jgi:hypothetical protein
MPMGNVKGGTNCRVCIDCEPMRAGNETCYRCYGENRLMHAPAKNDFAVNQERPPRVAPRWCPHRSVMLALLLIKHNEIDRPGEFARLLWPDSEGWQRRSKVGHGTTIGGGMRLAGGGFIGKLRQRGLIAGGIGYHYFLTEKGRRLLRREDD